MAIEIVRNSKSLDFPKGNCKIALDSQVSKCAPHTATFLMKLKSKFYKGKLESIKKDPHMQISNFEGLIIQMNKYSLKGCITDEDNNLPPLMG